MKKMLVQPILILIILVFTLRIPVTNAQDASGFVAGQFETEMLDLNDGGIDDSWKNVTTYLNITEFGDQGYVKFAHNESHLFSLFVVDSTKKWAAIEIHTDPDRARTDDCMIPKNDGWTFYIDQSTKEVTYLDTYYIGANNNPDNDTQNDLSIEFIHISGYHHIEIVRAMNTTDNEGNDFQFANGTLTKVKFASDTHHKPMDGNGPSPLYFLSVQFSNEVEVPDVPKLIDYKLIKFYITIGIFVIAFLFISMHFTMRQVFRPLDQCALIVDDSFKSPTLKDRWDEVFGNTNQEGSQ